MKKHIVNPNASAFQIDDVDAYLAGLSDDDEPMIDLGGGMVVPLREVLDGGDTIPVVWPRRTHDGQRMRDTETADVAGEVL